MVLTTTERRRDKGWIQGWPRPQTYDKILNVDATVYFCRLDMYFIVISVGNIFPNIGHVY